MIITETTLDLDTRTEGNCVCMHTVHCHVMVDNKCEFRRASNHGDCNFDAKLLSKTRKCQQPNISEIRQDDLRSPTQVPCTRSHLAEYESFKTRQFCQPVLVLPDKSVRQLDQIRFGQSIHSVEATTAFVHEHTQVLRYVRIRQSRHRAVVGSFK